MQKSLFRKYLKITSFTILLSFFLLGLVMLAFSTSNWQEEKQRLLERNADSVSSIAAESMIKVSDGQYVITREQGDKLQTFMTAFAENIDSDIFITDLSGSVIASAYGSGLTPETSDISPELVARAVNNQYIGQTTMDGMYSTSCYVVGVPITYSPEDGDPVNVGAVFASCSFRSFSDYRANLMQMFLLAAVAAFMVSFCIVWRPRRAASETETSPAACPSPGTTRSASLPSRSTTWPAPSPRARACAAISSPMFPTS